MRTYKAGMFSLLLVLWFITVFLFAGNAHALMLELSMDDLSRDSDSIVIGSVGAIRSQWNPDKTSIFTTVEISVEEIIKVEKELQAETITIVFPGGEAEGIIQAVSDMPSFNQGERTLLFLQDYSESKVFLPEINISLSTAPVFTLYGSFQGKLDIIDDEIKNQPLNEVVKEVNLIINGEGNISEQVDNDNESVMVIENSYFYDGKRWFSDWPNVSYRVNASGGTAGSLAAIQNAAATWSNAGARFLFLYDGQHSRTGLANYNGFNEVLWGDLGGGGALAVATIWFYGTGEIIEADIVFNTKYNNWSTTGSDIDVETVALHEFGHWLSLGHSDTYGSIMWWQYKGVQRTLHADDIAGIKYIYGSINNKSTFTDVPPDHSFFAEIEALAASGIATGWPDGTFRPSLPVARQAMVAFLFRAFDMEVPDISEPTFTDVPEDHPFFEEIEALAASGITTGWPDGTFRPKLVVTRQAAAAFLFRALELEDPGVKEPTFSDVPEDHPFFVEIEALAATGITTGWPDNTFRPTLSVTRQAMAVFLFRALELDDQ